MTSEQSNRPNTQKLRHVLRDDFQRGDFFATVSRDYADLVEYFLDDDQKNRIAGMKPVKRWIRSSVWLLKIIVLRLTPARRLILLLALIFLVTNFSSTSVDRSNFTFDLNLSVLGGVLILFVLMLELKDKLLARSELEAGRAVQAELMPEPSPVVPGWSLSLYTRTANEVGGDLIDFQRLDEQRCRITLADVAGKGLNAALMSAKLQATTRAVAAESTDLADLVGRINTIYYRDGIRSMFASLIYLELSPQSGTVRYINAGHFPPVHIRGSSVSQRSKGNAAIGLMRESRYQESTDDLQPGDALLLYSDGLTEAKNEFGEFFGEQRLMNVLPTLGRFSATEINSHLVQMVERFVGTARYSDDLSLVILKRLPVS